MSLTKNKLKKDPCNIGKNVPNNGSTMETCKLNKRFTRSNMPENNLSHESHDCDLMPIKTERIIPKNVKKQDLDDDGINKLSVEPFSIKNVPCHSNDYLFDFCHQDNNLEPNMNHKFYGCKKKEYTSNYCESFGLPDDPIFSNSPLFLDKIKSSPLDTDIADPWDLCVVNLDYIDEPWLIENQEVITPYWDVESLFPFEVEDIRQKSEPENINLLKQNIEQNNLSNEFLDNSEDKNNVFTSTPLKNQSEGLSVVSTINIANGAGNNVDISALKDQVIKALEEALKKKSSIANIDMKIQIVADLSQSPESLSQKSSVEVRINKSVEIEPCQSSSSSKENYFMGMTEITKEQKFGDSKKLGTVTISDLDKDWQDSHEIDLTTEDDDLPIESKQNNIKLDSSTPKQKRVYRKRGSTLPSISRTLRSCNVSKGLLSHDKANFESNSRATRSCKSFKSKLVSKKPVPLKVLSQENTTRRILRSSLINVACLNNSRMQLTEPIKISSQIVQLEIDKSMSKQREEFSNQGLPEEVPINRPIELKFKKGKQILGLPLNTTDFKCKEVYNKKLSNSIDNELLQHNQLDTISKKTVKNKQSPEKNLVRNIISTQSNRFNFRNSFDHNKDISTDLERRVTRRSLRNEMSQSGQNGIEKYDKDLATSFFNKSLNIGEKDTSCIVVDTKQSTEEIIENNRLPFQINECYFQEVGKEKFLTKENTKEEIVTEIIERRVTRRSLRNEYLHSSHNESDNGNILKKKKRETSQIVLPIAQANNTEEVNRNNEKLLEDVYTSQDPSTSSMDAREEPKRRAKHEAPGIIQDRLSDVNIKCSEINNTPFGQNKHEETSIRRTLRSSNQSCKENMNETNQEVRRTHSTSSFDKNNKETSKITMPSRTRTVSANFDTPTKYSQFVRRSLRSQTAGTKISSSYGSPECSTSDNSKTAFNGLKSPKISFDLSTSLDDSPRNFQTNAEIKGILKNICYDDLSLADLRRLDEINTIATIISCTNTSDDLPKLTRQDNQEENLDDKKEETKCLKENGITSRIKVVLNPMDFKEENDDGANIECPLLPIELPPPKKLPRISNKFKKAILENAPEIKVDPEDDIGDVVGQSTVNIQAHIKEIKNEKNIYNQGDFVWAQVAKYPFWPAVICNDPISERFYNEVQFKNRPPQTLYHLRFFGDAGKRAWINRIHLMLYSSKQDLEMIANKLKSESKSYNVIKPYLVMGSQRTINKWNKAIEEIESLKGKSHIEVLNYLVQSYQSYVNERREKRKLNILDASSESESEEPETADRPRKKRFRSYYQHVTAEDSNRSLGFDEINISVGSKNSAVEIVDKPENKSNADFIESSANLSERKPRKSLKGPKILDVTPNYQDKSLEHCLSLEATIKGTTSNEELDNAVKVTHRRSRRSLKTVDKIHISDIQPSDKTIELEKVDPNEPDNSLAAATLATSSKIEDSGNSLLSANKEKSHGSKEFTDGIESEPNLTKKQTDEASEVGSKTSSDATSSNSNMYSFEYQIELHKKNSLFNGLRNVKVCEYCLKQGDLFKCKGRCGGFFHLECASRVTQPRSERRHKKREKSPNKAKLRVVGSSVGSTPKSKMSDERCQTRSQSQCQIITIRTSHVIEAPKKDNLPDNFYEMSIAEQIDYGMKEMMSKFENRTVYDSTDSSSEEGFANPLIDRQSEAMHSPASTVTVGSEKSANKTSDLEEIIEEEKSSDDLEVLMISENASNNGIKHVTADSVILTEDETPMDITNLKCTYCRLEKDPPCYSCGLEVSKRGDSSRQKCSQSRCGRYYHPTCLKMWPQTQWSIGKWSKYQQHEDSFTCPAHSCHTCFSEELGSSAACRLPGDKLAKCLLCPAAFHTTTFCIPAGSEILGGSQIVCPRHRPRLIQPINTVWCFICSEGGNLVCCDTCPTSVHPECQPVNFTDDDKYICEDCESGRFPLYDEIVWVKLGQYRWWPAIVLFPNEVPENVRALKHQRGDFAVRFFGTHDHYWVNKARSFLFQEGDRGGSPGEANKSKNKVYETFGKAIEDAALAYKLKKEFKLRREAECITSLKPPPYTKINRNRPVGNVKCIELDLSNATACECDPNKPYPCGPDSNCINRLLMTECDPEICPAGIRCRNQSFQKREYPPMVPYKTQGRGWGLKCLAPIKTGQFVIEYVGELLDSEEYQRRIQKMHEKKEENYYFMTVDSDRMIDAGPKGNISRFMNHSCNPNCVTQKWTVKGDTHVGLFAKCNIDTGSELTFNYNLEVVGQEKKVCKCGATNCSGYIGVKAKVEKAEKSQTDSVSTPTENRRSRKYTKKRAATPPSLPPCFMCGRKKSDITCNNKFCHKGYHLRCLKLEEMPEVSKYACPRHNCNTCSNRTIRCCVKCTNSFCPSHSEGNVRHDKFLGFVCRLHDPGISSADDSSVPQTDIAKQKPLLKRRISLCLARKPITKKSVVDKEILASGWRKNKNRRLLKKYGSVEQSAETGNLETLQGKSETFAGEDTNKTTFPKRSTLKRFNGWKMPDHGLTMTVKTEALSQKYYLKNKAKSLQKIQISEIDNEVLPDQVDKNFDTALNNSLNCIHDISVAQYTRTEINEVNNETSEANIHIPEVAEAEITPSSPAERSKFETYKTAKRLRPKSEPTDESAVSSTTFDEGSSSKPRNFKKTCQPDPDRTPGLSKDNQASFSPTECLLDTTEHVLVDKRIKKTSSVRQPRKKFRFSVIRLSPTAKPS